MSDYTNLMETIDSMDGIDLAATNNFIATVAIRDALVNEYDFTKDAANSISIKMEIAIGESYTRDQVLELAEAFAKLINNLYSHFISVGYSEKDIASIASQLSLKLD